VGENIEDLCGFSKKHSRMSPTDKLECPQRTNCHIVKNPIEETTTRFPKNQVAKDSFTKKLVVVVSSFISDLGGSANEYERLLKLFSESEINAACELAIAQGSTLENPFGWVKNCIEKGYKKPESKADMTVANKKVLHDCFAQLNGKEIGGHRVWIGPSYISFHPLGQSAGKEFKITEPNFEARVRNHIRLLQTRYNTRSQP